MKKICWALVNKETNEIEPESCYSSRKKARKEKNPLVKLVKVEIKILAGTQ